jgi:hypothetical protein
MLAPVSRIAMSSRFARQTLSAGLALSADTAASQEAATKRASREIEQARLSTFEMLLVKFVSALMAGNLPPAK